MDKARFTGEIEGLLPALYRVSASILRSRADAEDAVQQALLNAWKARERLRPETMRAYVTRIAVNECRNIQRGRMRVVPVESMEDTPYDPPEAPALREALDALPEDLRTPLLLKYMEGYSEMEIVRALELPLPTVKSRLYRARKALQKQLEGQEVRSL